MNYGRSSFLLFLSVLFLSLSAEKLMAQDIEKEGIVMPDTIRKAMRSGKENGNLSFWKSAIGFQRTEFSYVMNTNTGDKLNSYIPDFSQQLRFNSSLSVFKLPILVMGQYGFGNETYSSDFFRVTIDQSRMAKLKRLNLSPEQVVKNTRDSLANWNEQALYKLGSVDSEIEKYKKLPDYEKILEYEQVSKTFADSFEFLDTSQVKELFAKRKELSEIREKHNAYKSLTNQKDELFKKYNANTDSLSKLNKLIESNGSFELKPSWEIKKLNLGLIQASSPFQTNYGRPLKGFNIGGQFGMLYTEILLGTSMEAKIATLAKEGELVGQFVFGIKQQDFEVLANISQLRILQERKIFKTPLERTEILGLTGFKQLGRFRVSGDISTTRQQNLQLKNSMDVREMQDSNALPEMITANKPSLNYRAGAVYSGNILNAQMEYTFQGSNWSNGSLSYPTSDISALRSSATLSLFERKFELKSDFYARFFGKLKNDENRSYQASGGLKWIINSFNTLNVQQQYVESGNKRQPVTQHISTLSYVNIFRIKNIPILSNFSMMRHEVQGGFIHQENYNFIANIQFRLKESLILNVLGQRFVNRNNFLNRDLKSLQCGVSGTKKAIHYSITLGSSFSNLTRSLIGNTTLAYAPKDKRMQGSLSVSYNQMFNQVGVENPAFSAAYAGNLISRVIITYSL